MQRTESTGTHPIRRTTGAEPADHLYDTVPAAVGVAAEVPWHRRYSPIGGGQRHYRLDPLLLTERAVCGEGVVVVLGVKAAYAFPADADGQIADYRPVAAAPGVTADADVLALLGYTVAADPDWAL